MSNAEKVITLLCNKIRAFRNSKGWTQERLAEKTGVHPTYISRIESGLKLPTLVSICKIAEALDVEVYELFIDEAKINSSDYKKKKLISIVSESAPTNIDIYSTVLNALHKKYKKVKK